jgi:hypothetical protein
VPLTNTGNWVSTGQYVAPGQTVRVRYLSGTIGAWSSGTGNVNTSCTSYALSGVPTNVPCSSLVARIGNTVFPIGNDRTIQAYEHTGGTLSIGYNLNFVIDAGSWSINYTVSGTPSTATPSPTGTLTPAATSTPTRTPTPGTSVTITATVAASTNTPTRTPTAVAGVIGSSQLTVSNSTDWISTG